MAKVDKTQVITATITGLAGSIPATIFKLIDYFEIGKEETAPKVLEMTEPTQRIIGTKPSFTTFDIFIILGVFLFSSFLGILVLNIIRKKRKPKNPDDLLPFKRRRNTIREDIDQSFKENVLREKNIFEDEDLKDI